MSSTRIKNPLNLYIWMTIIQGFFFAKKRIESNDQKKSQDQEKVVVTPRPSLSRPVHLKFPSRTSQTRGATTSSKMEVVSPIIMIPVPCTLDSLNQFIQRALRLSVASTYSHSKIYKITPQKKKSLLELSTWTNFVNPGNVYFAYQQTSTVTIANKLTKLTRQEGFLPIYLHSREANRKKKKKKGRIRFINTVFFFI